MPPNILPYHRDLAVAYAHKWAFNRNPQYYDFEKLGGDCTNFASQCLYAGTSVMDYTPTFGWFYIHANNKSPSWTGVPFFHQYITRKNKHSGPFGFEVGMEQVEPGDFVQLSFRDNIFGHTPIIVEVGDQPQPDNILIAAHTYDSDNRPLSTYTIQAMRFLHIQGVYR